MRIVTHVVVTVLLFFSLAGQALSADFFTVRLGQFYSIEKLLTDRLSFKQVSDLWVQKDKDTVFLHAGLFPDRQHAELLLGQLQTILPQAEIISTPMPAPEQWLPSQKNMFLEDLGYEEPVLLQGVQPYHSLHFPWNSSMVVKGSSLQLRLRISTSLLPDSTVTIVAEGVPLLTLSKQEIIDRQSISVSLDAIGDLAIGTTLDVEISGSFRATKDYCVDIRSKSLWLSLDNKSHLQFIQTLPLLSARQFFMDPATLFTFAPFAENHDTIEALSRVAGLIGSLARSKRSRIQFAPYSPAGKNIFIAPFAEDIMVLGSNLFISSKGSELLSKTIFPALIFSKLSGGPTESPAMERVNDISFGELGYSHRTAQGIGDLIFSTEFSALQLGGWPAGLLGTLLYTHSPVLEHDRSFLRVRLNGVLIDSREILGEGGQHSLSFSIPFRALQAKNNLEIVFSYYLNSGDCIGSYPDFEVSLNKNSFLSVSGYNPTPPLNLSTYPALFEGKGALLLGAFSSEFYVPMAHLMEMQGYVQQMIPDVRVTEPASLDTGKFDYAVLALDADTAKTLNPPVDLTQTLEVVNPLNNSVLLSLDTEEPVTVLQTFYTKNQLPLLLYQQQNSSHPSLDFTKMMLSSHSQANVGMISDGEWHTMQVGKKLQISYPKKKNMAFYWEKYRLLFFIFAGTILLLFLFYVYHRLAKEK